MQGSPVRIADWISDGRIKLCLDKKQINIFDKQSKAMMAQEHVNIPYIDDVDEGITIKVENCKNKNMKYAEANNDNMQDVKESQTGINGSENKNIEVEEEKKSKSPSRQLTGAFCKKTNESSTVAGRYCSIVQQAELERGDKIGRAHV